MARPNQLDAYRRLTRALSVDESVVVKDVGARFGQLTEAQAERVLLDLADGKYDGDCDRAVEVYRLAWEIWRTGADAQALELIRKIFPEVEVVSQLTPRQAARVIVELDRIKEPTYEGVASQSPAPGSPEPGAATKA